MRGRVDNCVQPVTVGLVAIERIVLDRRDHALELDTVDGLRGQRRADERVFRQVLEVSSVARIPREVQPTGQLNVEAATAGFTSEHLASLARERGIEARAQGDAGWQGGRGISFSITRVRNTQAGIATLLSRNSEPRDPWHVSRAHRGALGNPRIPLYDHVVLS